MKKLIKYILVVLVIGFTLYHSVYFKKLDEVTLAASTKTFNAPAYARTYYTNLLPQLDTAPAINNLLALLKSSPQKAFADHSHALGIGNIRYFLVRGEGSIVSIADDAVVLSLKDNPGNEAIKIATEFIYGNAIRDASGNINLNDFSSTADFNAVSEEVNKIIRKEVIPSFKSTARAGSTIKFSGAIELNQLHLNLDSLEIIPIQLTLLQ